MVGGFFEGCQSARSARTGSTRAARSAGRAPAKMVVISMMQPASPSASGSPAPIPKRRARRRLVTVKAAGTPTATPATPNARLFITTPVTTAALDAPSARRTPNSWVRRAAANEVTPYNPTNVSAAAASPNDANDGPLLFDTAREGYAESSAASPGSVG